MRTNSALKAAAAGLLILHLVLGWSLRAPGVMLTTDDASYLLLGRELLHFDYGSAWIAGAPPHGQYPPGYPALLAVSGATAPGRAGIGVVLNLMLSTAGLGVFTLLCWRWSSVVTLGALGIAAVNPMMLSMAGNVYSEPLFTLLMFLALWCAVSRPSRWHLAALAALAAALTRSIGVAVIAGLLIDWAWARRWRPVVGLGIAAALTVGLWFVRAATVPQQLAGQSYFGDATYRRPAPTVAGDTSNLSPTPGASGDTADRDDDPGPSDRPPGALQAIQGLTRRALVNASRYATNTFPSILRVPTTSGTILDNVAWLIVLGGLGIAGAVSIGRRQRVVPIVVVCYFGVLLVWPYVLWRFLVPVLPLLAFFVLEGARRLSGRTARLPEWIPVAAIAGVLMIAGLGGTIRQIETVARCDREQPYQSEGCFSRAQLAFLSTMTDANRLAPAGAILLTPKPQVVHYLTGRAGVDDMFAAALGADELDEYLRRNGVTFAVLSGVHARFMPVTAALRARCEDWGVLVNRELDGALLLRRRERTDSTASSCEVLRRFDGTSQ